MDYGKFILDLIVIVAAFGTIAWVSQKMGWNDPKPQQKPNGPQLEETYGESYREFFHKVIKPLMDANADSLALDYCRGLPQHMPEPGSRVGIYHGKLTFCYVFQRKYHMRGGITEEGGVKEPRKAYIPFPAADIQKELASHIQNYCVAGGMPPCQDVQIKDMKDGKIIIGFCFQN